MSPFDRHVARWFHDHHGIASTADLSLLGISDDARQRLVETGLLVVLFEGVYWLRSTPLDFLARCAAVCAADPSLVLCCHSAGTLLGARRCSSRTLHAVTNLITKPVGPMVKVHRTRLDLTDHTVRRDDGIRHTDALQTFFDLGKHLNDLTLRSIGEQFIADGLAIHADLAEHVMRTSSRGRPGSSRAVRVIGARNPAGKAADSHDEVVLLDALHRAGLTEFVRHPPVRLLDGIVVHPDLGWPAIGFYVEVDHPAWHSFAKDVEYDKSRDTAIRLTGAVVERITDERLLDLPAVVADLRALVDLRLRQVGVRAG